MRITWLNAIAGLTIIIGLAIVSIAQFSSQKARPETSTADQRANYEAESPNILPPVLEPFPLESYMTASSSIPSKKNWTFMVYMTADNNLDQASLDDINEMEMAGSTENVNVLALVDRQGGDNTTLYYVKKEYPSTPAIVSYPIMESAFSSELNMGEPANLVTFLNWSIKNFPSERYALVLWGHGLGWKGVGFDEGSNNDPLTPKELYGALTSVKYSVGFSLDIVAFDACLMQMAELALAIGKNNLASYIVGSQESVPGPGWNYEKVISTLDADPLQDIQSLVTKITDIYMEKYPAEKATLSAIQSASLENVFSAIDAMSDSLSTGEDWNNVSDARAKTEQFSESSYIDIFDFAQKIQSSVSNPATWWQAKRLQDSLANAVISNKTNFTHPNAHGLSIYFPARGKPEREYTQRTLGTSTWYYFLTKYLASQR